MSKTVLAFDFGASSGRAMLAGYNNGKITMQEIHRFSNDPVEVNGTLYWDILRLFFEIKQAINKAALAGGFDAIGIDTWGVDFGLLDKDGQLLQNPVHYRDVRTENIMEEVLEIVPKREIYNSTGLQFMRINTLFQMYYLKKHKPELLQRTDKMLFIPDLFAYFLTGVKRAEYTIASTSQMLRADTGQWDTDLLEKLSLPQDILPEIIQPGEIYGHLSPEICKELGCQSVPVIAVCSHDTGSAVAAVPSQQDDFIYVSCGTWSLFGTELPKPVITDESYELDITNEGGYKSIRFLKNIIGLWLLQESRRQWKREGNDISFAEIERLAREIPPEKYYIDCDYPDFDKPGNMPEKVREYCRQNNLPVPQSVGEVAMAIYNGLSIKYKNTLEMIGKITGKDYNALHLIGGGAKDTLLCQLTADRCGVNVYAGPYEATVIGNIIVQLIALKEIADLKSARKIVADNFDYKKFEPSKA